MLLFWQLGIITGLQLIADEHYPSFRLHPHGDGGYCYRNHCLYCCMRLRLLHLLVALVLAINRIRPYCKYQCFLIVIIRVSPKARNREAQRKGQRPKRRPGMMGLGFESCRRNWGV